MKKYDVENVISGRIEFLCRSAISINDKWTSRTSEDKKMCPASERDIRKENSVDHSGERGSDNLIRFSAAKLQGGWINGTFWRTINNTEEAYSMKSRHII
ncbi:hypothetical protein CEXT_542691 [Caerostris extrusa]|uniref:Uncharacterized protein n=1 Tax=Caerostris extrusa TaxID=172846 RepID=A0AAV4PP66_CAEEX|nr:hypothetical protein CEXT_542691 [Caerostris extrusa]